MAAGSSGKFKKRVITLTRTGTGSVVGTVGIGGQRYGKLNSFRARVTSSGATSQIELKDSLARVFYKDAADKDYQTAAVNRIVVADDTLTGISFTPTDATGAALTAADAVWPVQPVLEGPITVTWADADGAAGTLRLELYLEV
jgi:hypothetical protein